MLSANAKGSTSTGSQCKTAAGALLCSSDDDDDTTMATDDNEISHACTHGPGPPVGGAGGEPETEEGSETENPWYGESVMGKPYVPYQISGNPSSAAKATRPLRP